MSEECQHRFAYLDPKARKWFCTYCPQEFEPVEPSPPKWDKSRNQDELCECGHPYYRHFDTYDDMLPVGCKYCECFIFREKK